MSSVDITIIGVGAFLAPADSDHIRLYETGEKLSVDQAVADRLVAGGVAVVGDAAVDVEPAAAGFNGATAEVLQVAKVDDLVAYVGDDKDRALVVLNAEQEKDEPRKTLVAKLEAVIAAE